MATRKQGMPTEIFCPHCAASNPPRAYCCLTCFRVMNPKIHVPFWRLYLRPSSTLLIGFFIVFAGLVVYVHQWLQMVEAEVTLNLRSIDYNVSVVADKKRARRFFNFKKTTPSTPPKTETPIE